MSTRVKRSSSTFLGFFIQRRNSATPVLTWYYDDVTWRTAPVTAMNVTGSLRLGFPFFNVSQLQFCNLVVHTRFDGNVQKPRMKREQ